MEHIIGILNDDIGNFRATAAESLGNIGDERGIDPLIKLLENDTDNSVKCAVFKHWD